MIIALVAAAWGADWSPPERLRGGDEGPTIILASGEPLYVAASARPTVKQTDGTPVALTPTRGGWVIPADDADRVMRFDRDVTARRLDDQAAEYAWNAWELGAGRHRTGPPPTGRAALAASVRLRAQAIDDPAMARLGALSDAAGSRRLAFPSHAETSARALRGPAILTLRAAPRAGAGAVDATLLVDDAPVATLTHASRGAPRIVRAWLPPGPHTVTVQASPETDASALVYRTRGWAARPSPKDRDGLAGAELDWLTGRLDPEAFRPWIDDPGPAGDLARARFVALASVDAASDVLVRWTGQSAADGATALADGALGRTDLDDALVAAAVRAAPTVTPARLAAWLDRGRVRPVGVALIDHAAGVSGPDRDLAAARRGVLDTRFGSPLTPTDAAVADIEPTYGPGAARVPVTESVTVVLPDLAPRWPVLRLEGGPGAAAIVDGARWALDGRVAVALPPGAHTVAPARGRVWVVDPELTTTLPVPALTTWTLPATFPVPGAGEPGVLRIAWAAPAGVTGQFDDGTPVALPPSDMLTWRELPIPAGAGDLRLAGVGRAAVVLPTPRRDHPNEPLSSAFPGPTDASSARVLGRARLAQAFDAAAAGQPATALVVVGTEPADVDALRGRLRLDWQRLSRFDDAIGYVALPTDEDGVSPLAARVVPTHAASVRLAAEQGVVRVRAVTGDLKAHLGGRVIPLSSSADALLPLSGIDTLYVTGDGVVSVSLGLPRAPVDPAPPPPPDAPERLPWAEAAAKVAPLLAEERLPGAVGSFRARAGAVRSQHAIGDAPYTQGALEFEFLSAGEAGWWHVEAWAHAPRDAAGLTLERGWRGEGWRARVAVAAASAREHRSAELDVHGLRDWPVSSDVSVRAEAFFRATTASQPTGLAVDPRAWTLWRQTHPLGGGAVIAAWARPWRDIRLEGGLRAEVNPGPGALAARPYAMAAWLIDPKTSLTAEARVRVVAPDAQRPTGGVRTTADLRFDRVLTATPRQRWSVSIDVGWRPRNRLVGGLFLECLWSDERGTRDLRPDEDAFRALRAVP